MAARVRNLRRESSIWSSCIVGGFRANKGFANQVRCWLAEVMLVRVVDFTCLQEQRGGV